MLRYIDIVTIMSFIAMAIVAVQTIRHYRAKIPKPPSCAGAEAALLARTR